MLTLDNKRGVSLIVAYVLLITIGIVLAGLVYSWLEFYVTPGQELGCDDGTAIVIKDYDYSCSLENIELTLQNKGRFTIDGVIVRATDKLDSDLGIYLLFDNPADIKPADDFIANLATSKDINDNAIGGQLRFLEVQPYKIDDGAKVLCSNIAKQEISCQE